MVSYSNVEAIIQWFVLQAQCFKCSVYLFLPISSACSTHSVYTYFGSGRSCSYSSVSPPGGGCCTVCSHLAPAEVSLSYNDGLSPVVHNTGEQNSVVQCNTHYIISGCLLLHMHAWHKSVAQKCRPGFSRALCSTYI